MSGLRATTGLQTEGARAGQQRTATVPSDSAQRQCTAKRTPARRTRGQRAVASCGPGTALPPTALLLTHPATCAAPRRTRSGGAPGPDPSAHPPAQAPLQQRRRDRAGSFRHWFAQEGRRAGGRHVGTPAVEQCALCSLKLQLQQQQRLLGFTRRKKCSPCPPPQRTHTMTISTRSIAVGSTPM